MAFGIEQAGMAPVKAFLDGAPDLIAKLQEAGLADEAALISGAHGVLSDAITQEGETLLKLESTTIADVNAALDQQRTAFFAELDKRLNGLTLTNKLTYPGSSITL